MQWIKENLTVIFNISTISFSFPSFLSCIQQKIKLSMFEMYPALSFCCRYHGQHSDTISVIPCLVCYSSFLSVLHIGGLLKATTIIIQNINHIILVLPLHSAASSFVKNKIQFFFTTLYTVLLLLVELNLICSHD